MNHEESDFFPFALFDDYQDAENDQKSSLRRRGRRGKRSESTNRDTEYDQKFTSLEKTEFEVIDENMVCYLNPHNL
jgi:hypothetical protein